MAGTTYNRAVSQYVADTTSDLFIRDVSRFPELIKRTDFPLFTSIKTGPAPEKPKLKLEWGIRDLPPINDTLASADDSTTTQTPANIGYYQKYHVIQCPSGEKLWVTAVGATTLTVVRGFAGSTAAAIASNAGVRIIGIATPENVDSPLGPITQGELEYNYFQLFDKMIQFSDRARNTPTYEIMGDRMTDAEKMVLKVEAPQWAENTLLWGTRSLGNSTTPLPSTMGGVFQTSFNTSVVDLAGDILTEYQFLNGLQLAYNQVGAANVGKRVMMHPFYKRIMGTWYKDIRRMTNNDSKVNSRIDSFATDFGDVEVMLNHHMKSINDTTLADGRMLAYDPDDYTLRPYYSGAMWGLYAVAESGAYSRRAIRCDMTLEAINPEKRVAFVNLSTTALDYPNFVNP